MYIQENLLGKKPLPSSTAHIILLASLSIKKAKQPDKYDCFAFIYEELAAEAVPGK